MNNNFDYYLDYLSLYPTLDKSKEINLSLLILEGNKEESLNARNELILGNLRLVLSCAFKYYKIFNCKVPIQDLIEYGNLGLIDAASRFNYKKAAFSTFAILRINSMIGRSVSERDMIHVPEHQRDMIVEMNREGIGVEEYVKREKLGTLYIGLLRENMDRRLVSIYLEDDEGEYGREIVDNRVDVGREVEHRDLFDIVNKGVEELKPMYRDLIKRLYFDDMTHEEYGEERGVTHQAIQINKKKAMRLLRLKFLTIKKELI